MPLKNLLHCFVSNLQSNYTISEAAKITPILSKPRKMKLLMNGNAKDYQPK